MEEQYIPWLKTHKNGFILEVIVQAQAKHSKMRGEHADRLRLSISAKPVKGEANKEIIRFLSNRLSLKKSQVEIISGDFAKYKKIRLDVPWSEEFYTLLTSEE